VSGNNTFALFFVTRTGILTVPVPYTAEESQSKHKMVEFECRGCEFTKFHPDSSQGSWSCAGTESGTKFSSVDVQEFEWYDYDGKAGEEVTITNIVFALERA